MLSHTRAMLTMCFIRIFVVRTTTEKGQILLDIIFTKVPSNLTKLQTC